MGTRLNSLPTLAATTNVSDVSSLLRLSGTDNPLFFQRQGRGLAATGEVVRAEFSGTERFIDAEAWWLALCHRATDVDTVQRPARRCHCLWPHWRPHRPSQDTDPHCHPDGDGDRSDWRPAPPLVCPPRRTPLPPTHCVTAPSWCRCFGPGFHQDSSAQTAESAHAAWSVEDRSGGIPVLVLPAVAGAII